VKNVFRDEGAAGSGTCLAEGMSAARKEKKARVSRSRVVLVIDRKYIAGSGKVNSRFPGVPHV